MKKYILLPIIALSVLSCSKSVSKQDLTNLNGFWEISKVETQDGEEVDYKINLTVDNFQLDTISLNSGTRKKGMPQLDGTYLTNDIIENFSVTDSAGIIKLNYKTNYANWSEQVLKITPNEFVVKNQNDVTYFYKRFEGININK